MSKAEQWFMIEKGVEVTGIALVAFDKSKLSLSPFVPPCDITTNWPIIQNTITALREVFFIFSSYLHHQV